MQVNGTLVIKCEKCNVDNEISSCDAQFDIQETNQRDFGLERNWIFDIDFDCDNCENNISGTYEKWEGPVGQGSVDNILLNGGKEQNLFVFDFSDEE